MDQKVKECLDGYRRGDIEALGELVEEYRRPLFGFIIKMTEGRGDADEIFQEVWLRAIKRLSSFKGGNFLSWLFRIAHNLVIDRARKSKREVDLVSRETGDNPESLEDRIPDEGPGPAIIAREHDTQRVISAALKVLPAEQREVFLLRSEGDMSFKEIAEVQGVSINTALARMQYALEKLRRELKNVYE